MDYTIIAQASITAVLPYLVKGGEEIAKGIGKDLWELIKKPFTKEKEKTLLSQLQEKPEDPKLQGKVEGKLEELLEANPNLAAQLQDLLKQLPAEQKVNTQTITGTGNMGFQDVKGSQINIHKNE